MTHSPVVAAAACALEVSTAVPCEREATAAARSQLGDTEAAPWLCAVDATVIGVPTVIAATVSVRRQWARPRSARLRLGPTIAAAAAKTPTATMFARITERRDNVGLCALCP